METRTPSPHGARPPRATSLGVLSLLLAGCFSGLALPEAAAAAPYQPPELRDPAVQDATLRLSLKYANAVPGLDAKTIRWFLYVIEHRESTFQAHHCNYNDGAQTWNEPRASYWPTRDHIPHGCGLTQLTGWWHAGMPYPNSQATAPDRLYKGVYGMITPPRPVSRVDNPFDPGQNIERFLTEHVLPDYVGIKQKYSWFTPEQTLRAVAFHWNKGDYVQYDPKNCDYLCLYDKYVGAYKPAVLNDKSWPAPGPTASFATSPNVNRWWIEVTVKSPQGPVSGVTASINGGAPVALKPTSWGSWGVSTYVPAGASVSYVATVNGAKVYSAPVRWP